MQADDPIPFSQRMTTNESISPEEQCADCLSPSPQWAVVNRGVLVCTDCCYVHRMLGRHISQVKSLKHAAWHPAQLEMVRTLCRSGANTVWEHGLLDPAGEKKMNKPGAQDPIFPTKDAFIKAKYVERAFSAPRGDAADANAQLISCARTHSLLTSLRLLAAGASPNRLDSDKGTTAMHTAVQEGQRLQLELLCAWGGSPHAVNDQAATVLDVATQCGEPDMLVRLRELSLLLTSEMSFFLTGRRPRLDKNECFFIPELVANHSSAHPDLVVIRRELRTSPDAFFEKVVQDVYDEVDRRSVDAHFRAALSDPSAGRHSADLAKTLHVAVFLPSHPGMSAVRNQMRQKLAKYDSRDFASLIIDVLKESKRRYFDEELPAEEEEGPLNRTGASKMDESLRLDQSMSNSRDYDEVADYMPQHGGGGGGGGGGKDASRTSRDSRDMDTSATRDDILELRERITEGESRMIQLNSAHTGILKLLQGMQNKLEHLVAENSALKEDVARLREEQRQMNLSRRLPSPATAPAAAASAPALPERQERRIERTESARIPDHPSRDRRSNQPPAGYSRVGGRTSVDHDQMRERERETREQPMRRDRDYGVKDTAVSCGVDRSANVVSPSYQSYAAGLTATAAHDNHEDYSAIFPDNLVSETERLTGAIRSLLSDAQKRSLHGRAPEHAHTIASLVNQMIVLIPSSLRSGGCEPAINALMDATMILSAKCNAPALDSEHACHAAYNVAKAAKNLLVAVS